MMPKNYAKDFQIPHQIKIFDMLYTIVQLLVTKNNITQLDNPQYYDVYFGTQICNGNLEDGIHFCSYDMMFA